MHRTQLYIDDDLWKELRDRARKQRTTISNLVRQAARDRYLGDLDRRRRAMQAVIGIRKDWPEELDSTDYVRGLRRDTRIERLRKP